MDLRLLDRCVMVLKQRLRPWIRELAHFHLHLVVVLCQQIDPFAPFLDRVQAMVPSYR